MSKEDKKELNKKVDSSLSAYKNDLDAMKSVENKAELVASQHPSQLKIN